MKTITIGFTARMNLVALIGSLPVRHDTLAETQALYQKLKLTQEEEQACEFSSTDAGLKWEHHLPDFSLELENNEVRILRDAVKGRAWPLNDWEKWATALLEALEGTAKPELVPPKRAKKVC